MAGLFDSLPAPEDGPYRTVTPNVTVPVEAVPRVARQCRAILDRLRRGPAKASELCAIGINYRARISELRQAGYAVRLTRHDHATGETWYELVEGGTEVTGGHHG